MPFTPSTAAQNTATLAGTNQANLTAALTALQSSISGGNLAPAAFIDAILSSVGYQAQHDVAGNSGTTTSTSFVDAGYSSMSWTAPIAKTYLVHVDASVYASAGTADTIELRLVVDGSPAANTGPVYLYLPGTNIIVGQSWRVPVSLTAASHTLKLQWRTFAGAVTLASNSNTRLQITITG
jgi:hypothetical protein